MGQSPEEVITKDLISFEQWFLSYKSQVTFKLYKFSGLEKQKKNQIYLESYELEIQIRGNIHDF